MVGTLSVQWTVTPKFTPQPLRACNRCGAVTPFRSSGKIRLNANRKRIDAWLIYRCTACDKTWNRPILTIRACCRSPSSAPPTVTELEFEVASIST